MSHCPKPRSTSPRTSRVLLLVAVLPLVATLLPSPAGATTGGGQFVIRCRYSHSLMDDPIVFPGQPGASHLHDFYGNKSVDAYSTTASMLAGTTTCRVPSDTAGYWAPAPYLNGTRILPPVTRVYYIGSANQDVETFPPGLKMIGGNKAATSPAENPHVSWYCGEVTNIKTPRKDTPYDCTPYADYSFVDGVIEVIDMPNCWNGIGLEPSDVVYPEGGACPSEFPHVLPKMSQRVHTHVMNPLNPDGTVALSLSSGPFWTLHADFWNTWQQPRLDQLVSECIVAGVHCGAVGPAPKPSWTREFGTRRYDLTLGLADGPGGVYAVGTTNLTLPGQKRYHRTDAFVRVYGAGGEERWTRQFGTSGIDRALGVAVDHTGVYVVGSTDGVFEGQHRGGGADAFLRRYDLQGNELWTRQFGGSGDDEAAAVSVHRRAIYVAGSWGGLPGTAGVGSDGFVRRYLPSGKLTWKGSIHTDGIDRILAVAAEGSRVYVGGSTDAAVASTNAGGSDAFVKAFSTNGGSLWARQMGTPGDEGITGVLVRSGSIFAAGSTTGALGGPIGGEEDGFLLRLDGGGQLRWLRQFGTAGADEVHGMDATSTGLLVAGATTGAFLDQVLLGETDAFLTKYDVKGAQLWTSQLGTDDFDAGLALTANDRAAYVGGETHGAFPGQVNEGDRDAFVTKVTFR
ncbi:MAG TPA: DUF1996 domain-containing protein [Actinomycetota bacterium]